MKGYCVRITAVSMLAVCSTISGRAQSRPLPQYEPELRVPARTFVMRFSGNTVTEALLLPRVISQTITIALNGVTVEQALNAIAAEGKFTLLYSRDVVPVHKKVSVTVRDGSVADALKQVLRGEELELLVSSTGQMAIVPSEFTRERKNVQGIVTGRVISAKTRQPVEGARVTAQDAAASVTTGSDGVFRISVTAGEQKILVRAVGFTREEQSVTVRENETVTLEIMLESGASVLDEVVVTGTVAATERKAIVTPITVITADDIEKRGITRIEDLLRGEVPGVFAFNSGAQRYAGASLFGSHDTLGSMISTTVTARGGSTLDVSNGANPLKTYIDGVELLDPAYLGTIDPQSIERIEILTGPQAATVYGSGAMGGVMQIFTKRGHGEVGNEITVRLRYGMLQNNFSPAYTPTHNHAVALTGGGPMFSYSGNVTYNYTGQWQPDMYDRMYGVSMGGQMKFGGVTFSPSATLTRGDNGTTQHGYGIVTSPIMLERLQRGEYEFLGRSTQFSQRIAKQDAKTLAITVDVATRASWKHTMTFGLSDTKLELAPRAPDMVTPWDTLLKNTIGNGDGITASYNTTVIAMDRPSLRGTVTGGLSASWRDMTQVTGCLPYKGAPTYEPCNSSLTPLLGIQDALRASRSLQNRSGGGFGSLQVGLFDRAFATFGIRGERNPAYGKNHKIDWTPTTGVAYTQSSGNLSVKLLGSYGRATRPPRENQRLQFYTNFQGYSPFSILTNAGNPQLGPEYTSGPQVGVEVYYGNLGSLTVNRYVQYVKDLIEMVPIDSVAAVYLATGESLYFWTYQWRNTATIKQHGWEGTGTVHIGSLSLKGVYSWNDSRITSVYGGTPSINTFLNTPTHTGHVSLSYATPKLSATLVTNYIGSKIYDKYAAEQSSLGGSLLRLQAYVDRVDVYMPPEYGRMSAYTVSDFILTGYVTPAVTLTLNIDNLTNDFTSDVGPAFPTLGRKTSIGVSWRFGR